MLWSPNEVLAYLKEDLNLQNNVIDKRENKLISKTAAFGGFPPWSSVEQDFIFIAENSEIYGPNPLFTIPSHPKEIDLNVLSTRILSADYQGLSSKKIISLKHAQLLMPDISTNIHAVVNYFLLFDTEARGFIRPACLAYITSDKYKLVRTADSVLEMLSEASTILQHCNMLHTIGNLKVMLQEITSQTIDKDDDDNISRKNALQNKVTEDVTKDIQDIIDVIEAYEGNDLIDKQLSTILDKLKNSSTFSEVSKLFSISSSSTTEPTQWKYKNHHSQKKNMKSFYSMCGTGLILGLYHLYILHKHAQRKYENIYLSKYYDHQTEIDERLHFGACVKISDMNSSIESFPVRECTLNVKRFTKVPSLDNEEYFLCLDAAFEKILLDFLNWEMNSSYDAKQNNSFLQSSDLSDTSTEPESTCSSSSGYLSYESEQTEGYDNNLCGHIVTLENMWDILDNLQRENPGIESEFLEILKLFDDTKKLLFSLLTRTPIVIISTPEECHIAQNFIKALSVFIPRGKHELLLVDLDRKEPFRTDDFKYIAALNICVHSNKAVEEIIPHHIWHSLCILNLRDCSLTAPAYTGILLTNIDERFRMLPLEGPAFPIFVGILCEVQSALEWWLMVTLPSVNESNATSSILSKGFSRLDGQILLNLSKICRS